MNREETEYEKYIHARGPVCPLFTNIPDDPKESFIAGTFFVFLFIIFVVASLVVDGIRKDQPDFMQIHRDVPIKVQLIY